MALPTKPGKWIDAEWLVAAADGAQSSATLIAGIPNHQIVGRRLLVTADGDNSVSAMCRVGYGTAAAPTTMPTAALAGCEGVVLSHPDIAAGSGVLIEDHDEAFIVPVGQPLIFSCDAPTGGNLTIVCQYKYVVSPVLPA